MGNKQTKSVLQTQSKSALQTQTMSQSGPEREFHAWKGPGIYDITVLSDGMKIGTVATVKRSEELLSRAKKFRSNHPGSKIYEISIREGKITSHENHVRRVVNESAIKAGHALPPRPELGFDYHQPRRFGK